MDQYGYWSAPRRGIVKVHGEQGALSLQMQPDDQCIALDETNPEGKTIIWVVSTDSRGVKTVCKPYEVTEYVPKPPPSLDDFDARLKRMEEFIYAQFGNGRTGREKPADGGEAVPSASGT